MPRRSAIGHLINYINISGDFRPLRRVRDMFTTIEYVAPNREVVYKIEDGQYSEKLSTYLANKILFSTLEELARFSRGNVY